jgi:transcriptional regulator EpsA
MIQTALASAADMPTKNSVKLSEDEQVRLIRAIESAIEVSRQDQFHAWMSGPFRALLPHETVVCLELGEGADAHQVDCLHHNLIDAETMNFLCHPEHGLAVRLARSCREATQPSTVADANAISALLAADGGPPPHSPQNAVIHRIRLLSGAAYSFVLVNVPPDQADRCRHLLKLLSSHLKMALARALPPEQGRNPAPLTQRELEILRWMGEGKSNREISAILGINPMTLKHHIGKVYRKLDVQSRAEAVSRGLPASDSPPQ